MKGNTASLQGDIANNGATVVFDQATSGTYAGAISGAGGSFIKTGAGAVTVSGNNTYTGATNVKQGTLIVSGSLSATSSVSGSSGTIINVDGWVNDAAGITSAGMVQGHGTISNVNISAGGTLAPGLSTANSFTSFLLVNSGDVTFADSTSTLSLRLGSSALDCDHLQIASGNLNLNGAKLTLDLSNYVSQGIGTIYDIVWGGAGSTGTGSNVFAQGSSITASNGEVFAIHYAYDAGFGATDIALELIAVPEPATWAMVLSGFGMFVGFQRLRRNRG